MASKIMRSKNSLVIITTWKTRHRSIGTTLTMPKSIQILEKQIRRQDTRF